MENEKSNQYQEANVLLKEIEEHFFWNTDGAIDSPVFIKLLSKIKEYNKNVKVVDLVEDNYEEYKDLFLTKIDEKKDLIALLYNYFIAYKDKKYSLETMAEILKSIESKIKYFYKEINNVTEETPVLVLRELCLQLDAYFQVTSEHDIFIPGPDFNTFISYNEQKLPDINFAMVPRSVRREEFTCYGSTKRKDQ